MSQQNTSFDSVWASEIDQQLVDTIGYLWVELRRKYCMCLILLDHCLHKLLARCLILLDHCLYLLNEWGGTSKIKQWSSKWVLDFAWTLLVQAACTVLDFAWSLLVPPQWMRRYKQNQAVIKQNQASECLILLEHCLYKLLAQCLILLDFLSHDQAKSSSVQARCAWFCLILLV